MTYLAVLPRELDEDPLTDHLTGVTDVGVGDEHDGINYIADFGRKIEERKDALKL